eukprot:CAMPEP_0168330416 /NCGR_PEP_ID=MMETSP0213-20121227/7721_1 /TAXON_ID=151035 /ORGANISM="Euplotes harpa, Strain FSP1.4" /LENGTH=52 /DNA_ID=CAMNT_0008333989 /DNA_START=28 /DNA_END=184 /DNA_ORIENTATION=+
MASQEEVFEIRKRQDVQEILPFLGDVAVVQQEEEANKSKMYYYIETSLAHPN